MHKENVEREQANPSKKHYTTFLHFEKKQGTLNTEKYSESSKKALAQYGTSTDNYKILHDDDLFDKDVKAHGYIQKGQPIPASFISHFGNTWTQHNIYKLYEIVIASLKNRPGHTKSTELQQLHKYVKKEIRDHSYYTTINKYPALGRIIKAVEAHGLEHWIGQYMVYLIDKTMEEKQPVFVGIAQAITKVIDKLQCGITSMRGIGEYHGSFVDFLIVLMSISTLATRWLTANFAGPTIRFLRSKRNDPDMDYNIYGINISNFLEVIAMWRTAYNYNSPMVYAKDQTKVAELIEICKYRQKWIGSTMTMEELHNKISSFKKATYITVYALSACIPGIPPIVIAVIPFDQKEKAELNNYNNNLIMSELYYAGAMTIGLYFDGATLD
ncbi:hypothetical protein C2G38_2037407 [Gigaspora rosea]|uniref:Uncharacterized protein n=1 Tax=Gigaspora rosea TaxID=44941 RepID=A0A397V5J2_9GLOM|nr:hypothetical protein C2G38_2037407 [Gigaspora rosea]